MIADLRDSRARLAAASDTERRRLERNLHDGAQQKFIAFRMKLTSVREQAREIALQRRLGELDGDLEGALESLRELAQGIYPALLADEGLGPALMSIGDDTDSPVQVSAKIGRFPIAIESAMYYCALEALQNAHKHAGSQADPMILVSRARRWARADRPRPGARVRRVVSEAGRRAAEHERPHRGDRRGARGRIESGSRHDRARAHPVCRDGRAPQLVGA